MFNEGLEAAAQRVLAGDESVQAAKELEGVLLDDYPDDDRLDDLLEALTLYAPGQPAPYVGVQQLRTAIMAALDALRREQSRPD